MGKKLKGPRLMLLGSLLLITVAIVSGYSRPLGEPEPRSLRHVAVGSAIPRPRMFGYMIETATGR